MMEGLGQLGHLGQVSRADDTSYDTSNDGEGYDHHGSSTTSIIGNATVVSAEGPFQKSNSPSLQRIYVHTSVNHLLTHIHHFVYHPVVRTSITCPTAHR